MATVNSGVIAQAKLVLCGCVFSMFQYQSS